MDSKIISSYQCPMEGSHALSIEFNFKFQSGLSPIQTGSNSSLYQTKNLQNHNNEDFFIQLLNARLHFTNDTFPALTSIEEILDQPLFLNPHTKLDFSSDNPYFYFTPPKNISDKFTTIRDTCRFLQLGFVSSMSFEEKLSLPNANYNNI